MLQTASDTLPLIPPTDGRQSPVALAVQRGTGRLLRSLGLSIVTELPLLTGRRADVVALSGSGEVWIVEIKSCKADFTSDRKWRDYAAHCDQFFFAVSTEFDLSLLPEDVGVIVADAHAAEVLREGPRHPMPPATRKAVTLRFAAAAATRLHRLHDPGAGPETW